MRVPPPEAGAQGKRGGRLQQAGIKRLCWYAIAPSTSWAALHTGALDRCKARIITPTTARHDHGAALCAIDDLSHLGTPASSHQRLQAGRGWASVRQPREAAPLRSSIQITRDRYAVLPADNMRHLCEVPRVALRHVQHACLAVTNGAEIRYGS